MKTRRLIPDINLWVSRKHGEVDFFLTQLLTGHGFLRSYFVEKGILDGSPNCPECGDAVEDIEHVLFHCPRFDRIRNDRVLDLILLFSLNYSPCSVYEADLPLVKINAHHILRLFLKLNIYALPTYLLLRKVLILALFTIIRRLTMLGYV